MILEPGRLRLILPEYAHLVEPFGPIRIQVEFTTACPIYNAVTSSAG